MGMTIDEAITWLNTDDFESKGFEEATSVAIDTMRKYQKIQELMKADDIVENIYFGIEEVIEDGNDD